MSNLKPYLIRAVYEWCIDQDLSPFVLVDAFGPDVVVPRHAVQEGRIILNLRPQAVQNLALGNQRVEFNARFGGTPMHVVVPVASVLAIYAKENGQGMVFDAIEEEDPPPTERQQAEERDTKPMPKGRPVLKVVK